MTKTQSGEINSVPYYNDFVQITRSVTLHNHTNDSAAIYSIVCGLLKKTAGCSISNRWDNSAVVCSFSHCQP